VTPQFFQCGVSANNDFNGPFTSAGDRVRYIEGTMSWTARKGQVGTESIHTIATESFAKKLT
jgi:hypothetical protein